MLQCIFRRVYFISVFRTPSVFSIGCACLLVALMTCIDAVGQTQKSRRIPANVTKERLDSMVPRSPNPYLNVLPAGVAPDWEYWKAWLQLETQSQALESTSSNKTLMIAESEPNQTQATAQFLAGFGAGAGDDPIAVVMGGSNLALKIPSAFAPFPEDDGEIPLAGDTGLAAGPSVKYSAFLGDGPHGSGGSGAGDFDFYAITGVSEGDVIKVDVDTTDFGLTFDSTLSAYDNTGKLIAFNDDEHLSGGNFDSLLMFTAPADGDYFISVGSFLVTQANPFDSGSGDGFFTEGPYEVFLGVNYGDSDFFSFEAEAGDILGATHKFVSNLMSLYDPNGVELISAAGIDLSSFYPNSSPLPRGGRSSFAYVLRESGTYAVRLFGPTNEYRLELRIFRPQFDFTKDVFQLQTLFVDFDGSWIDPSVLGAPSSDLVFLSPLSAFLSRWGLTGDDEDALIDAILAVVTENLETDIAGLGLNPGFDIQIRNSRDHPGAASGPHTSFLIVGGTISELGIATLGAAQSIDVGNFEAVELGVVLLDILSEPFPHPGSLNTVPINSPTTKIQLIATCVGNMIAHQAGHLFGNFHTDQFNASLNLMDQGGNLAGLIGLGPDLIFGTADDVDVDFGADSYAPNEGFTGAEDTLNTIAFGLTAGVGPLDVPATISAINSILAVCLIAMGLRRMQKRREKRL